MNKGGGIYSRNAANPLNYSFVFVIAMMVGAFVSSIFKGDKPEKSQRNISEVWRQRFGDSVIKHCVGVFIVGIPTGMFMFNKKGN